MYLYVFAIGVWFSNVLKAINDVMLSTHMYVCVLVTSW